ncbi:uncharacterized protein LOC132708057 [Cylas formicarius]|uniref:uncharacterized protein LOC132708057 n=1 Tax=Cylas formicarius TaxID=197179 RepID=UPI002958D06A|nr:uncharacterized protein LOC132708057 [Cylas formicarius]
MMGSYGKAIMVGFICRLCSEMKKNVIHLYTAKAAKLGLRKMLKLLPITVDKYDNLPKTICQQCIERLEAQYDLHMKIRKSDSIYRIHRNFHSNGNCPVDCPLHGHVE